MPEYRVSWVIDLEANDPIHAAQEAEFIQLQGFYRGVFLITDEKGNDTQIDLDAFYEDQQ